MIEAVHFILSLSIIFALIIGIVRFRKVDPAYYPFFYDVAAAFVIEIVVQLLMQGGHNFAVVASLNVYSFIDFFLFAWLFHNWRLFNRSRKTFISIIASFFVAWVIITFFIGSVTTSNYYFRILYSFTLIFFSVSTFNKVVVN